MYFITCTDNNHDNNNDNDNNNNNNNNDDGNDYNLLILSAKKYTIIYDTKSLIVVGEFDIKSFMRRWE